VSDPGNALTASSLLLTVLTLIYTVWSDALKEARKARFSPDFEARPNEREPVRSTFRCKAIPLAVASWLAFFVFLPRALCAVATIPQGFGHLDRFDDVLAALVISELFLFGLAVAVTSEMLSVRKVLQDSWTR
jgi:hypothetical protein